MTADLRSEITGLRSSNSFGDDFAKTVAPGLVGNSLRGRVVTLVVLPTASQADVNGLKSLVGVAGGSVGGTLRAGKQLVDASDKQLVDELGNQLEGRAKGVQIPADASAYERIGALIARAVGTEDPGRVERRRHGDRHPRRAEQREPAVDRGPAQPSRRPRALRHRAPARGARPSRLVRGPSSPRW